MRVESIPLYDLHDHLLGWSMYLVVGDADVYTLQDWERAVKDRWTHDWSVERQNRVAYLRTLLPTREDRGVESWDSPRDKEMHVWFFRPCPFDHLETM